MDICVQTFLIYEIKHMIREQKILGFFPFHIYPEPVFIDIG